MRFLRAAALTAILLVSTSFMGSSPAPHHSGHSEMSRVELAAWNSSVTVWNGKGYGSGTYVTYEGWPMVLTAYHVIANTPLSLIRTDDVAVTPAIPVYTDPDNDLALLLLPAELSGRIPVPFGPRRVSTMDVGEATISVSSPNANSRLLLNGRVAGYNGTRNMWVHGLTWFGASGSALFDKRGRFIGLLSGMDHALGLNEPMENLIVVEPIEIDWDVLFRLATSKPSEVLSNEQGLPVVEETVEAAKP